MAALTITTDLEALAASLDVTGPLEVELRRGLIELAEDAAHRAPRRTGRLAAGFGSSVERQDSQVTGEVRDLVPYAGHVRRNKRAPLVADELVYDPAEEVVLDAVNRALRAKGAE